MTDKIVMRDEPAPSTPSLFHNDNPAMIIEEATEIANQLADIIRQKRLYKAIGAKSHVFVEGWTTLGALLGVFPYPESSIRVEREDEIAYEATVIVRTLSGIELSKGEAICSSKETNWKNADEYAIKSMATTRATSKALRIPLGWIMVLAGYSATPAEEMMGNGFSKPGSRVDEPAPTKQVRRTPKSAKSKPESIKSEMPVAEKVEDAQNIKDGEINTTDWEALKFENEIYAKVVDTFSEGETITAKAIRDKARDMVGEQSLTPDEKKEVFQFLRGK